MMTSPKITEGVMGVMKRLKTGVMSVMITLLLLHMVIQLLSIRMKLKSFT